MLGFGLPTYLSLLEASWRHIYQEQLSYLCIKQHHYTNDASGNCSNCAELHEEQIEKHFVEH